MATFSSKKLSEVYNSLMHGDDGAGSPVGMSDATTNVVMKTGNNTATPINFTTKKVCINKDATNSLHAGTDLNVVDAIGTGGGGIWGGSLSLWDSTVNTGGKLYLHNGNSTNKIGDEESFHIKNKKSADGIYNLQTKYNDGAGNVFSLLNLQVKGDEVLAGIGTDNPTAPLTVQGGSIGLGNTKLNESVTTLYVNMNGSNTDNGPIGDDANPGSSAKPFKTLERALEELSPYGRSYINLYAGTASSQLTYNIAKHNFYGISMDICTVMADGSKPSNSTDYQACRDNTFLAQNLTNAYNGATLGGAYWRLDKSWVSLDDLTLNITYPGSNSSVWKVPFKITGPGSAVSIGRYNSYSVNGTYVDFKNQNTNTDGSDSTAHTVIVNGEQGEGVLLYEQAKIINQAGVISLSMSLSGAGKISCNANTLECPATGFTHQANNTIYPPTTNITTY